MVTYECNWAVKATKRIAEVRSLLPGMPLARGEKLVQGPLGATSNEIRAIYYRNIRKGTTTGAAPAHA